MISKGVVPGPFLFVDETNLISLIFGGLIFTNIFLLCIGFFATNLFAKVTSISKKVGSLRYDFDNYRNILL